MKDIAEAGVCSPFLGTFFDDLVFPLERLASSSSRGIVLNEVRWPVEAVAAGLDNSLRLWELFK